MHHVKHVSLLLSMFKLRANPQHQGMLPMYDYASNCYVHAIKQYHSLMIFHCQWC